MATSKKIPARSKQTESIRAVVSLPAPLPFLIAQRNLFVPKAHSLAEGAD
ncbi:MAG TPA: hypothetical protein VG754_02635 [Verrucomicrobiae bacterium]|nr:hypothetical protein [Verrucomicrobiae bacterium]